MLQYAGSIRAGSFWFRIWGYGIIFRTPKSAALFSERNGLVKYYPYGPKGYRLAFLKPNRRPK